MRKQENRLTRISLSIVSLFVACHIWRLVPTAYEAFHAAADHTTVLVRWPGEKHFKKANCFRFFEGNVGVSSAAGKKPKANQGLLDRTDVL